MDEAALRQDIPDAVLAAAWSKDVQEKWGIWSKQFYTLRRSRGIRRSLVSGPRPAWKATGATARALEAARKRGDIGDSTARKWKSLTVKKPKGNKSKHAHDRQRVGVLFSGLRSRLQGSDLSATLVLLTAAHAFLREFRRVGIDPCLREISWDSGSFEVATFLSIIKERNAFVRNKPSMWQAVFGLPALAMHVHNWFTADDAWHEHLKVQVSRWQSWAIDTGTQVQLIAFLSTFNGHGVLEALSLCGAPDDLPILARDNYAQQREKAEKWLLGLLAEGRNVFTPRFRLYQHNSCMHGHTALAAATVHTEMKKMLTRDESVSLATLKTYDAKIDLLSCRTGYSDDPEKSFVGKNLCNTLSSLGHELAWLADHAIFDKSGHPDGPGALAFYGLLSDSRDPKDCRKYLLDELRRLWPKNVQVEGCSPSNPLHLGHDAVQEVNEETVQFASCAMSRMIQHLLTGVIPHHLARSSVLKKKKH